MLSIGTVIMVWLGWEKELVTFAAVLVPELGIEVDRLRQRVVLLVMVMVRTVSVKEPVVAIALIA